MGFGYGKIILLGEHAVVYGYPALAAAIRRGITATATKAERDSLTILDSITVTPAGHDLLSRAFAALLATYGEGRSPLAIVAEANIPQGAGLGSSAALGVAVADAIDATLGLGRTAAERAELSLVWERVFHGNPSGIDSVISACGGIGLFRRGEPLIQLRAARPLSLVVGHSGEPGSTKAMVAQVARIQQRDPKNAERIFEAIGALVDNGRLALEAGDLVGFGKLMDLNQGLLNSLMLSTARLEELCAEARSAGAYGAKLTGGGGGGCMIALVEDEVSGERVVDALTRAGADAFFVETGT